MRLRCIGQNFTSALRLYVLEHRKNTTIFQISLTSPLIFFIILTTFCTQSAVFVVLSQFSVTHIAISFYVFQYFLMVVVGC